MQSRKICGFSGIVFSRMGVKESGIGCCWPAAKAQQIKCLLRQRSPPGSWRAATEGRSNRWKPKIRLKDLHAEQASIFSIFGCSLLLWGLKGASSPFLVAGRGVSRGREGGVETPLSPSGPAERPRRRCRLQKPSGLPHAIALCMRNITKKHPPCGCTAGALKGSAGVLSGWCPCPQPGRRRSSQRPPQPSPGRGRSGAGPCWGCPGAC